MLGYKGSLSKFKKIEIISSIFSDHNIMRLEINYKKKLQKTQELEAKQCSTEQPMGHLKIRGNPKMHRNKLKQKHNNLKTMGHNKSNSKR